MNVGPLPAGVAARGWMLYAVTLLGAVAISAADPILALISAAVAAGALFLARNSRAWPALALLAVGIAAADPQRLLPWALAGGVLVLLLAERHTHAHQAPTPIGPALQLARSRRRGEPASVVVVTLPDEPDVVEVVLDTVRTTDGFAVRRAAGAVDVLGVLDGADVERAAVERRIREAAPDAAPQFGWATFPEDGLTLDVLVEQAAGRSPATVPPARPKAAPAPAGAAFGTRDDIAAEAR